MSNLITVAFLESQIKELKSLKANAQAQVDQWNRNYERYVGAMDLLANQIEYLKAPQNADSAPHPEVVPARPEALILDARGTQGPSSKTVSEPASKSQEKKPSLSDN